MDRRSSVAKLLCSSARVAVPSLVLLLGVTGEGLAACPTEPQPPVASAANSDYGTVNDMNKKVFVSTRSGLQNGGFRVILRNAANQPIPNVEVWLSLDGGTGAYLEQLGDEETVCSLAGYPECPSLPDNVYTYVETHTDANGQADFTQRWGGHGVIQEIQMPRFCSNPCETPHAEIYQIVFNANLPFRSTDMNADGRWDECDRAMIQPCLGSSSTDCVNQADFNLDNVVNNADLAILQADITAGCGEDLTTCGEDGGLGTPGCPVQMVGVISDLATDFVGPTQVGLTWTAPSAQGGSGTVGGYQVRYSTSPITNCNFNSATLAGRGPLPLSPGTPQSYTVSNLQACQTYYFAVKAYTSVGGLVAAVSNVPSDQTTCGGRSGSQGVVDEMASDPVTLELSIVNGHAVREQARVAYSVPSADAGKDGRLKVYDATGRHIRTLVSGPVEQGRHMATWDLRSDDGQVVGAGVYFARLWVGEKSLSRTLVVLAE